jgi:hypothetical protein
VSIGADPAQTRPNYPVAVRRRRVIGVVTVLVVVSGLLATATHAASGTKTIASYCSPSGDVCYGVMNRSGAVYLELTTVAHYFDRYRLCVRAPGGGSLRCASFPVVRRGSEWGSFVKYARHFQVAGPGTYRVTWKLGANPLGPSLRFRLPLAR